MKERSKLPQGLAFVFSNVHVLASPVPETPRMFRQGMHDLKVWPCVKGDGSEVSTTPGRASSSLEDQMGRLAKVGASHAIKLVRTASAVSLMPASWNPLKRKTKPGQPPPPPKNIELCVSLKPDMSVACSLHRNISRSSEVNECLF